STSSGDSAKNRSGSSMHGSSPVLRATGIAAGLGAALTAAWLVTGAADAAAPVHRSTPSRHPAHLRSLTRLPKRWAHMTKAADPISGPRPPGDPGRSFLDRIPGGRMRTRRVTANGGDAGVVLVLLVAVLLLEHGRLDRRLAHSGREDALGSARPRYRESACAARKQGGPDTARQADIQCGKRAFGTPIGGRPNVNEIAQHPGHLLPCAVVGTPETCEQPRQPARPGATTFLAGLL